MTTNIAGIGHNIGKVLSPPSETEFLADLKQRFPSIETDMKEFEAALKTFPERITDDEAAQKLADLLKKMSSHAKLWDTWRITEKRPWDMIGKVIQNYFGTPGEKVEKWIGTKSAPMWKARLTTYLEGKAEAAREAAAAAAAAERAEADRLQRAAEDAERRRLQALADEAAARQREEEAKQRAIEEERKAEEAKARAAALAQAEAQAAEAKRQREDAERQENATLLAEANGFLAQAENLDMLAEASEATEQEIDDLDELVRPGGPISNIGSKLSKSDLLNTAQKLALIELRDKIVALRDAQDKRAEAKEITAVAIRAEQRRLEQERQDRADAEAAAVRAAARAAHEAAANAAREAREAAEREAEEARAATADAKKEAREARADAREAVSEQKDAAKIEKQAGAAAVKTESRANRMEQKLDNSSDADMSRTRGDFTVASLSGRFAPIVQDRDALVAYLGPLGPYLNPDHVDAAVGKYMRQHQGEWARDSIVTGKIPGVAFVWEAESRLG